MRYVWRIQANALIENTFLWIGIPDAASPNSDRAYLELNSIALLSNFDACVVCWIFSGRSGKACSRRSRA